MLTWKVSIEPDYDSLWEENNEYNARLCCCFLYFCFLRYSQGLIRCVWLTLEEVTREGERKDTNCCLNKIQIDFE